MGCFTWGASRGVRHVGVHHMGCITWGASHGVHHVGCVTWSVSRGVRHMGCIMWVASRGVRHVGCVTWGASRGVRCDANGRYFGHVSLECSTDAVTASSCATRDATSVTQRPQTALDYSVTRCVLCAEWTQRPNVEA